MGIGQIHTNKHCLEIKHTFVELNEYYVHYCEEGTKLTFLLRELKNYILNDFVLTKAVRDKNNWPLPFI